MRSVQRKSWARSQRSSTFAQARPGIEREPVLVTYLASYRFWVIALLLANSLVADIVVLCMTGCARPPGG